MLTLFNVIAVRMGAQAAWRLLVLWIPIAALLLGAGVGAWGAWNLGRAPLLVDLAQMRESHFEAARVAAIAGARRLQAAHERSDVLGGQLAQALATNSQLFQEKTHALRASAAGRVCLSDRTLGVLHGSPGIRVAGLDGVPAPEHTAAAAGAAAGADSDTAAPEGAPGLVATDTDIGVWAIGAGARYEECRARLDALIDWHADQLNTHERPTK